MSIAWWHRFRHPQRRPGSVSCGASFAGIRPEQSPLSCVVALIGACRPHDATPLTRRDPREPPHRPAWLGA
jgi:hypothetical protein